MTACGACGELIEPDDGIWYHPDTMSAFCDGDDAPDLTRQAYPARPVWHAATIGAGVWRELADGGVVAVRPAWQGGYRVTISRPQLGIYLPVHSRRFDSKDPA